jgi:FkbM family methyltransferase
VLDIGANIGTHAIPVSKHVQRVVAFEPNAHNFNLLTKNCAETGCKNISCNNIALGSDTYQASTTFDYGKTVLTSGKDITVTALDNIKGFPSVDFIKIDVEGMEPDVLEGATGTVAYYKPHLFIEMQDERNYQQVFDFLAKHQYNVYWYPVATYNPRNHKGNTKDIFGPQHGVLNWFATQVTTDLTPVVDGTDTIEKMVKRHGS